MRLQRGVAEAESAPLADPQQVERILTLLAPDEVHATVHVAVDVIAQGKKPVGAVRIAPVEQVDVLTGVEQATNQGPVLLQVGHIGAIYQGVDDEHGHVLSPGDPVRGPKPVQNQLVFPVHGVLRRDTGLYVIHVVQVLQTVPQLATDVEQLL